jgi:hypothetical protein
LHLNAGQLKTVAERHYTVEQTQLNQTLTTAIVSGGNDTFIDVETPSGHMGVLERTIGTTGG